MGEELELRRLWCAWVQSAWWRGGSEELTTSRGLCFFFDLLRSLSQASDTSDTSFLALLLLSWLPARTVVASDLPSRSALGPFSRRSASHRTLAGQGAKSGLVRRSGFSREEGADEVRSPGSLRGCSLEEFCLLNRRDSRPLLHSTAPRRSLAEVTDSGTGPSHRGQLRGERASRCVLSSTDGSEQLSTQLTAGV